MQQPNRYIITEVVKLSNQQKVNAQGKAREDVLRTAIDLGFEIYNIKYYKYNWKGGNKTHHYPLFSKWIANRQGKKFVRNVHAGDTILIQEFYLDYMQNIATECLIRGAKVIFLVHDVQCIRFNKQTREIQKLNNASLLLVHTEAMKHKLEELGVTTPMNVIQLFDYYSDDSMTAAEDVIDHKYDVVFAGNLAKSEFLPKIFASNEKQSIHFLLYGMLGDLVIPETGNIIYKGVFNPSNTGSILGGWGLVWDGDSIDTCTGDMGGYLRYNSSHKTSLYLVSGIPVIVWECSSLADWVKEQHIGIVIASLRDIGSAIDGIANEEYHQMVKNAQKIGEKLRNGCFLKQTLNPAL